MSRHLCSLVGLLSIGLAGCQSLTHRAAGPPAPAVADREPPPTPAPGPELLQAAAPAPGPDGRAPFNVLVLSGGGAYGAYTAGVLAGWSEAGTRPQFDVVTGVSTGALIATLAFLGPDRDADLRRFYTTVTERDVFARRPGLAALFADSLADSRPLERLIERAVDDELLREVAAEHAKGRRLYVGTTHLAAKRLVVWDMGEIARRGTPADLALFRRVLLASAAFPGLLPPVPLPAEAGGRAAEEMHVDGGVTASLFFRPPDPAAAPAGRPLTGSTVYVIVAGRLYADPEPVRPRVLPILGGSVSALLHAHTRGDLVCVYAQAQAAGMNYRLAAIPEGVPMPASSTSFDRAAMARLYAAGRRQARAEGVWQATPPGLRPGEEAQVRGGPRPRKAAAVAPPTPADDRPIPPAADDLGEPWDAGAGNPLHVR